MTEQNDQEPAVGISELERWPEKPVFGAYQIAIYHIRNALAAHGGQLRYDIKTGFNRLVENFDRMNAAQRQARKYDADELVAAFKTYLARDRADLPRFYVGNAEQAVKLTEFLNHFLRAIGDNDWVAEVVTTGPQHKLVFSRWCRDFQVPAAAHEPVAGGQQPGRTLKIMRLSQAEVYAPLQPGAGEGGIKLFCTDLALLLEHSRSQADPAKLLPVEV